jgi:eukaryotic-like serine/threonine-protein kinase
MADLTADQFAQRAVEIGIIEQIEIEKARAEINSSTISLDEMIRVLQRRGQLTTLQADKIRKGDRTGFFFGYYKVLYLIGVGTFARVYRAVNIRDGRVVALKVLRKRFRDDMASMEQFLREGRVGLRLRHPNIVAIYEVQPDIRHPYLVMEFVEGQTLREMMQVNKTLEPIKSLKLLQDVAAGLSYASTLGVTHRDLKMSNVLVSAEGRAKLVDFGLAALSDPNNERAVADCPNARAIDYAALERGTSVRNGDPRSDIYFAGILLYNMLTGFNPMTDTRDRLQRLNIARFHSIPPVTDHLPDLPQPVVQLCGKAMTWIPEERYQTAAELQADIRAVIDRLLNPTLPSAAGTGVQRIAELTQEGQSKTIMVVESKVEMQDLLRERLKSRGYRVLMIGDPRRALDRFKPGESPPADLVIFSAPELGSFALEAFNLFALNEHTRDIPALLLVDRKQAQIIRGAKTGPHRQMLAMPLKVRDLRVALIKLLQIDHAIEDEPAEAAPSADGAR